MALVQQVNFSTKEFLRKALVEHHIRHVVAWLKPGGKYAKSRKSMSPEDPRITRLLAFHFQPILEVCVCGVCWWCPVGSPFTETTHDVWSWQTISVPRKTSKDFFHSCLIVGLCPVATLIVRSQVQGMDGAFLISAKSSLVRHLFAWLNLLNLTSTMNVY